MLRSVTWLADDQLRGRWLGRWSPPATTVLDDEDTGARRGAKEDQEEPEAELGCRQRPPIHGHHGAAALIEILPAAEDGEGAGGL